MSRALLLLALQAALLTSRGTSAAQVFVIADTDNQTRTISDAAKETIAEANFIALDGHNDTLADSEDDHEPVVRKKRTFGDIVFRGLADVLGYNVARKPPQVVFPPPLAPVPGIDGPLQAVAVVPVLAAPAPQAGAPAPAPCGRAVAPCAPPPPPPPPKQTQPPCPRPRANPRPRPKPRPRPTTPAPPPPCARPRANPSTPAPCTPPAPPPAQPKADSNLETISSNFRLNFNFNRAPATSAPVAPTAAAATADDEQEEDQEQEQIAPVAIQPRAAKLPQDPPRKPRVYLDAFVVRNGVPQRVHTVDAQTLNNAQADDDYLIYDDEQQQQNSDDDDEYVQESRDRAKAVKEFGTAVDRFWEQKQKPSRKLPANDYRNVHFGDRDLANQIIQLNDEKLQTLQKRKPKANRIPSPKPQEDDDDEGEVTTTTQDPRRPLKPRVLPPTEQNPNQIDTVTVRVPPIYKEKRPKKLHRARTERPDIHEEETAVDSSDEPEDNYDSDTEDSSPIEQTEPPRRKRRRKNKRRARSVSSEAYSAGDYDYYGNKLPMSEEEEFFRGLTIPPPTKDADLARLEKGDDDEKHFLDDHERLTDDPEKIKYDNDNKSNDEDTEEDRADESERVNSEEKSGDDEERTGYSERADEVERSDRLSPHAKVRETGYQNKYVRASNVQVDSPNPLVATIKRKTNKLAA
ncbi:hypothetical protein KGM_204726 [Danaus plexippus plexippus]|uniref:Uncharacterized protein n=1 Tax=Danaus plexippus plexippus TaxID=278856 RepID=A0A212FJF5_DANPL|nr:hypothetical protein KGM_204726 [Danaus plexippus plexippus]